MVGWPRLVGIGLLAWLVGPGWLVQVCWHRFVGHGWLAQPGWPRYVGWLAGFVGSKYFQISSWYPGPGSPRIFEPIFFVGILGEPDQRYSLLMPQKALLLAMAGSTSGYVSLPSSAASIQDLYKLAFTLTKQSTSAFHSSASFNENDSEAQVNICPHTLTAYRIANLLGLNDYKEVADNTTYEIRRITDLDWKTKPQVEHIRGHCWRKPVSLNDTGFYLIVARVEGRDISLAESLSVMIRRHVRKLEMHIDCRKTGLQAICKRFEKICANS